MIILPNCIEIGEAEIVFIHARAGFEPVKNGFFVATHHFLRLYTQTFEISHGAGERGFLIDNALQFLIDGERNRHHHFAVGLPHGVLFRGGAEERIRKKLLIDGHIDTVIGLPSNLFYSTGIPVCILVLKKCKKPDDVLFINAAEHFVKGKRQNQLTDENIAKIIRTYQFREEEARYSRRVGMAEIEKNEFNLNISRYISTAVGEAEIDLEATHGELAEIEKTIAAAKHKHNEFLTELGLSPLP